jgi:hypothetical protein
MKREPKSVKVVCGKFSERYKELCGKTVAAAKEFLQGKVTIAEGMVAVVEDDVLDDSYNLHAGETVEFKQAVVTVVCGANEVSEASLVGKSIAFARKATKDALNIPRGAKAILDGTEIERKDEGRVKLEPMSRLEFIKEDGRKG